MKRGRYFLIFIIALFVIISFLFLEYKSRVITGNIVSSTFFSESSDINIKNNDFGSNRFFVDTNGQPFFYLADTIWTLFYRPTTAEAEAIFKDRASKGFNVISNCIFLPWYSSETNQNGNKPFNNYNTNSPNSGYWDHVDEIIDLAARYNLTLAIVPLGSDNYVNPKMANGKIKFNSVMAYNYGKFIGARYKDKKNIVWMFGGDDAANSADIEIWRQLAKGIIEGEGGIQKHLITYHPNWKHSSSQWFQNDAWLSFNTIQSDEGDPKTSYKNYDIITADYNKIPTKPTLEGETKYERYISTQTDFMMRKAAYWSVFSGGSGFVYGAEGIFEFCRKDGKDVESGCTKWTSSMNYPGASQMQYLKNLILSRPFFTRIPDQSIIKSNSGDADHRIISTRGIDFAFVYLPLGGSVSVDMSKISSSIVKAYWYDPRSGSSILIGNFSIGVKQFTAPSNSDWVLSLEDASINYSAPGLGIIQQSSPSYSTNFSTSSCNISQDERKDYYDPEPVIQYPSKGIVVTVRDADGRLLKPDEMNAVLLHIGKPGDYEDIYDRKSPPTTNPMIWTGLGSGDYNANVWAWDQFAGKSSYATYHSGGLLKLEVKTYREVLFTINVFYLDGITSIGKADVYLDSDNTEHGDKWTERAHRVTASNGSVTILSWPIIGVGDKYRIRIKVNGIDVGGKEIKYGVGFSIKVVTSLAVHSCTENDWVQEKCSENCVNGKIDSKWSLINSCGGGVQHPLVDSINCSKQLCNESAWNYTISPGDCPSSGTQTKIWTKADDCSDGISHQTEILNCTYSSLSEDTYQEKAAPVVTVIDTDGDGISDSVDKCLNTPNNTRVDIKGCTLPKYDNFKKYSTKLYNKDISNLKDLTLSNTQGSINFKEQVSLVRDDSSQIDLDNYVDIEQNKITIDSTNVPELNKKAILVFRNVDFPDPLVLIDGKRCEDCNILDYSNGILTVEVNHFTTYEVVESSYYIDTISISNNTSNSSTTLENVTNESEVNNTVSDNNMNNQNSENENNSQDNIPVANTTGKNSYTWVWILLIIILVIGIGYYFWKKSNQASQDKNEKIANVQKQVYRPRFTSNFANA